MWLPQHIWHEKALELKALVVLEKHIRPYFTKYLSFSFFYSKLFSFWGCYDWNVQIP